MGTLMADMAVTNNQQQDLKAALEIHPPLGMWGDGAGWGCAMVYVPHPGAAGGEGRWKSSQES